MSLLRKLGFVAAAIAAGLGAGMVFADPATQEAVKLDAKDFARTLVPTVKGDATTSPSADTVPGYVAGTPAEAGYYRDPDRLKADANASAPTNPGYVDVQHADANRSRIPQADLDATVTRSMAIQDNPAPYATGFATTGGQGSCHPLPPVSGSPGSFEQACNSGYGAGGSVTKSCTVTAQPNFTTAYNYSCARAVLVTKVTVCTKHQGHVCTETSTTVTPLATLDSCTGFTASSQCSLSSESFSEQDRPIGIGRSLAYSTISTRSYDCGSATSSPAGGSSTLPYWQVAALPPALVGTTLHYAGTSRDESQCAGIPGVDVTCGPPVETCSDASPQTRSVNGVAVTQACWAWTRSYQCRQLVATDDCSDLTGQGCSFARQDCLTNDKPCRSWEDVYNCPVPASDTAKQYICDGDVYCIDGDCETIDRTPNGEFGQAAVALNAAAQAGRELDPNSLKIFQGTRLTCSKLIAGITNCCAPRGIPIIGGGCSSDDKLLKDKREKGLCHYVGSYCSSSVLGVCLKKREAHCCYVSKLSRIIQEQGRPQLGLGFGSPKHSICDGFTIDQFAELDLSKIDFSEVLAEFVDAAKLPDDLQTATDLQARIQAYYAAHK